jgi:hypothetical protein
MALELQPVNVQDLRKAIEDEQLPLVFPLEPTDCIQTANQLPSHLFCHPELGLS